MLSSESVSNIMASSMKRKLAKLVRLGPVVKHPNADRLQIATVGGWEVVVGLDCKENDEGVYFEIDSVLPEEAWTAALPARKIKTIRLRGHISQGLFLRMTDVPALRDFEFEEDADVTDLLGVVKRFDPQDLPEGVRSNCSEHSMMPFTEALPDGPPKTDEPRIQSNMYLLRYLEGRPYYITLKYDGSSATFGYVGGEFRMLSRNFLVTAEDSVQWYIAKKYDLTTRLANTAFILQGEVIGPKIQGNPLQLREPELRVFNIFDVEQKRYLDLATFLDTLKTLNEVSAGLPLLGVNILYKGDSFDLDVKSLLKMAEGEYPDTKNPREGLVVRSQRPPRASFKVINNAYLLKLGRS